MAAKKKDTASVSPTDPVVSELGRRGMNRPGHASHAILMIPADEHGTLMFAVEVSDVTFKKARVLDPSGDPEIRGYSMERCHEAIAARTYDERLGWYSGYSKGGKR